MTIDKCKLFSLAGQQPRQRKHPKLRNYANRSQATNLNCCSLNFQKNIEMYVDYKTLTYLVSIILVFRNPNWDGFES